LLENDGMALNTHGDLNTGQDFRQYPVHGTLNTTPRITHSINSKELREVTAPAGLQPGSIHWGWACYSPFTA
jgi:hypothetical protein